MEEQMGFEHCSIGISMIPSDFNGISSGYIMGYIWMNG
jgi:hypothetical protein